MNEEKKDNEIDFGKWSTIMLCALGSFSIVASLVDTQTRKALASMLLIVSLACAFYFIASAIRQARLNSLNDDKED